MKKFLVILSVVLLLALTALPAFAYEPAQVESFCNGFTFEPFLDSHYTYGFNPTAHYNSNQTTSYYVENPLGVTMLTEVDYSYEAGYMTFFIETSVLNTDECEFFFNSCSYMTFDAHALFLEVQPTDEDQFETFAYIDVSYFERVDDTFELRTSTTELRIDNQNLNFPLVPFDIAMSYPYLFIESITIHFPDGLRDMNIIFGGTPSSIEQRAYNLDELYTTNVTQVVVEEVYTEGFMESIFGWIDDFLSIKLFGIGELTISLGTILGVCLIIPVALWILKMVAGG